MLHYEFSFNVLAVLSEQHNEDTSNIIDLSPKVSGNTRSIQPQSELLNLKNLSAMRTVNRCMWEKIAEGSCLTDLEN